MREFKIKKSDFIRWCFESGYDDEIEQGKILLANRVIADLYLEDKVVIEVQEFFDSSNHDMIPCKLIDGLESETDDLELGDLGIDYKLKLI